MLVIRDLVKTYSSGVQALKGVSLELHPGVSALIRDTKSGQALRPAAVERSEREQDSFIFEFLKTSRGKTIESCGALTPAPVFTQWLQDSENRHLAPEVSLVQFLSQNRFIDLLQLSERKFFWKQLESHRCVLEFIA